MFNNQKGGTNQLTLREDTSISKGTFKDTSIFRPKGM